MVQHSPLPRYEESDVSSDSDEEADPRGRAEAKFWWQWDRTVGLVLRTGAQSSAPRLVKHLFWAVAQWILIFCVSCASAWINARRLSYSLLLRNAFLIHYVTEFLGCTGMYSGFNPLFPYTWYRFAPGTLKEPLFGFLGDQRTLLDVLLSVTNVVVPVLLAFAPEESRVMASFALCVFAELVFDYSAYIGAMGCFYGPISAAFAFRAVGGEDGHVAALQVILLTIYVGCGLAKMGPWFVGVTALEWTQPPPFASRPSWRRLFFQSFRGWRFYSISLRRTCGLQWRRGGVRRPFTLPLHSRCARGFWRWLARGVPRKVCGCDAMLYARIYYFTLGL